MKSLRPRQLLLLVIAVTLPISAVFIQSRLISRYETELGDKHRDDAREEKAREIGRLLLGILDEIKLAEAARASDGMPPLGRYYNNAVAVIGLEDKDRALVWPWDGVAGQPAQAVSSAALALEGTWHAAPQVARRIRLELLQRPSEVADEYGVPYWTFAAAPLLQSWPQESSPPVLARVAAELATQRPLTPYAGAQLHNLLKVLRQAADPDLRSKAVELEALVGQREAEFDDLLLLRSRYPSMAVDEEGWKKFTGHAALWLVGMTRRGAGATPLVLVVRADRLQERVNARQAGQFVLGTEQGKLMDRRLDDLRVIIPDGDLAATDAGRGSTFHEMTIALVLAVALLGAYLLWRDTRRESALVQLRSQFVSGVSHELKTPLTSIRMFADTLQIAEETGAGNPAKRAEYLNVIVQESERLTRLLNNVLAFAQIERGSRTYDKRAVSLQDILEDAVRIMRFPLEEKGFELELDLAGDVPVIEADRDAIEQAVLNLLSNAMKYSGKNRHIALQLRAQEGGAAVISVTDHGIGIPLSEQKRIFESFYRVPGEQGQAVGGTGLGLAIVDHIVRAHGGSIEVQSEPGVGSTFSIRIPLAGGIDS